MENLKKPKNELDRLAFHYGTDKCQQLKHPYTPFYHSLFGEMRDSVKKVLEIGVGVNVAHNENYMLGASLYMWRDYFPNAQIYGADILPKAMFSDDRIETFLCDQSKEEDLRKLAEAVGSDVDICIDDGSHNVAHQRLSCEVLMPLFKKDVIYVIEDTKTPEKLKGLAAALDKYDCFAPELNSNHLDSNLLVVKHKC